MAKKSKNEDKHKGILNLTHFYCCIGGSIFLTLVVYFANQYWKLGFDKSLTAYVAILGAVPTAYLWVIKERKKEEELKNKNQELRQVKISELNKVYVDAVNQFYTKESFLAGAYSLNGLIDDWANLSNDDENKEYYYTRIQQILGIILSKTEERKTNSLFKDLSSNIIFKMMNLQDGQKIDLSIFDLSYLDLTGIDLSGYNLRNINFTHANLSEAILSKANLSGADLSNANLSAAELNDADLSRANLSATNLDMADLTNIEAFDSNFISANLTKAILTNANIYFSTLEHAQLEYATLDKSILKCNSYKNTNFKGASFEKATLSMEELSTSNFSEAKLIETNFTGADLSETVLNKAIFIKTKVDDKVFFQRGSSHIVIKLKDFLHLKSITLHLLKNSTLIDIPKENHQAFLDYLKIDYKNDMKNISENDLKSAYEKFSTNEI